jgi:hypothetical protein
MTRILLSLLWWALSLVTPLAGPARDYPVHDTEEIHRSLPFAPGGPRQFELDNVFGSIDVAVHEAPSVEMSIVRRLKARTAETLELGRKEVTLDITEQPGLVRLYVNGPFREDGRSRRWRGWNDPGYVVYYDFKMTVPRDVHVRLRTVNDGHIRVQGVTGGYEVENVNGGIEMLDVSGAGDASSVNADVKVVYSSNPSGPSSFSSVNGDLVVLFQRGLGADLRVKTFNGDVYTDFDMRQLAARAPDVERRGSGFIYKPDRSMGLRVGAGGPELRFETLNGNVCVLER